MPVETLETMYFCLKEALGQSIGTSQALMSVSLESRLRLLRLLEAELCPVAMYLWPLGQFQIFKHVTPLVMLYILKLMHQIIAR